MTTELKTVKELAILARVDEKTIRGYIKKNKIPHYRPDPRGRILIKLEDFESWLETRRVEAQADPDVMAMLGELAGVVH